MLPARHQQIIAVVVLVAGAFFAVMGTVTFLRGRALASRGAVIEAELTATSDRQSDSDTGHQVRYRFRVGGREYRREGIFGTEVGSDVSAEAQGEAVATGRIAVRYLPEDPSVNEPAAHSRPQGQRGLIAMGLGLLMVLAGAVRFVLAGKGRAR